MRITWIPGFFAGDGAALPFDKNDQPTAAFNALVTAMQTTAPVLNANYVVNAAGYQGGAVAPGEIVTIYGANYGPANLVNYQLDASGKFSTNLGGVEVLFDGVAAPLVYV